MNTFKKIRISALLLCLVVFASSCVTDEDPKIEDLAVCTSLASGATECDTDLSTVGINGPALILSGTFKNIDPNQGVKFEFFVVDQNGVDQLFREKTVLGSDPDKNDYTMFARYTLDPGKTLPVATYKLKATILGALTVSQTKTILVQ